MLKTIKDDDAAVAARQLSREHQGHGVPADAVRRVRAADARDGGEGQPITGDALAKLYSTSRKKYYGTTRRLHRRRLHRQRVELHPALLPRLLRVPVRDVVHGGGGAVDEGAVGRRDATKRYLRSLRRRIEVPIDLLKDAGVDMTTDEPLDLTDQEMNQVMDEMEKLLASK
jgi:oligoendopeptidase F